MRSATGACAVLSLVFGAMSWGSAQAETSRSVFCVAVRTVPVLDQNNYVMGASGPVYMTPNFTTDVPEDRLISEWRSFISDRHPVGFQGNPDDNCYAANTRREHLRGQHGDIKNLSVSWKPAN